MSIKITTQHSASSYGIPVCLVDGELVNDSAGIRACMDKLGWGRLETAEKTGKSLGSIDNYLYGRLPVPAEVWNVLRAAICSGWHPIPDSPTASSHRSLPGASDASKGDAE